MGDLLPKPFLIRKSLSWEEDEEKEWANNQLNGNQFSHAIIISIGDQHPRIQGPNLQLSVRPGQVPFSSYLNDLICKIIGVNKMVSF